MLSEPRRAVGVASYVEQPRLGAVQEKGSVDHAGIHAERQGRTELAQVVGVLGHRSVDGHRAGAAQGLDVREDLPHTALRQGCEGARVVRPEPGAQLDQQLGVAVHHGEGEYLEGIWQARLAGRAAYEYLSAHGAWRQVTGNREGQDEGTYLAGLGVDGHKSDGIGGDRAIESVVGGIGPRSHQRRVVRQQLGRSHKLAISGPPGGLPPPEQMLGVPGRGWHSGARFSLERPWADHKAGRGDLGADGEGQVKRLARGGSEGHAVDELAHDGDIPRQRVAFRGVVQAPDGVWPAGLEVLGGFRLLQDGPHETGVEDIPSDYGRGGHRLAEEGGHPVVYPAMAFGVPLGGRHQCVRDRRWRVRGGIDGRGQCLQGLVHLDQ